MKKIKLQFEKKLADITIKDLITLILCFAGFFLIVHYFEQIGGLLKILIDACKPFLYGIVFAFIFNIPMRFFQRHLPKYKGRESRFLAAMLALVIIVTVIVLIGFVIIPQIADNVTSFVNQLPAVIDTADDWLAEILQRFHLSEDVIAQLIQKINDLGNDLLAYMESLLPMARDFIARAAEGISNVGIGIVVAIYLTISKEKLFAQCKEISETILPKKVYDSLFYFYHLVNDVFKRFVSGQLLEALIIGVLCYFGCLLLNIPYAPTCSLIIGCTNIIPIFGPIIGTLMCVILIAFTSPIQALVFLVFGIVLQQFESNIIYPHIVGNSVGLEPLWSLFAITVFGKLFGVVGMIIGLPIVSIAYELIYQFYLKLKKTKK